MKTRKIIALFVALLLAINTFVVYGTEAEPYDLESIIISVKQKAQIDDTLSEFEIHTLSEDGNKLYNLSWNDKYECEYVYIQCDSKGRVSYYNHYDMQNITEKTQEITYADAVEFADSFIHKLAPELFEDEKDCLVREVQEDRELSDSVDIVYNRMHNGIMVEDNTATVGVEKFDDKFCINYASINYDYDTAFEDGTVSIENYQEAYKNAFPVELAYRDINIGYRDAENIKTALLYRNKENEFGYILASDGKIAEKDTDSELYANRNDKLEASEDISDSSGGGGSMLSDKELAEIKNIEGLIDEEKALEGVKRIPGIEIDGEYKITYSDIRKEKDGYYMSLNLENENEDKAFYASIYLDAKTGELIRYSNSYNIDNKKDVSAIDINNANIKINEFLDYVISAKRKDYIEDYEKTDGALVTKKYSRAVNGIKYIDDSIYLDYDTEDNKIVSYRYDFEENAVFDNPETGISADDAYEAMLKINPIELRYVKTDGVYKQCYTLDDKYIQIDAFTGEKFDITHKALSMFEYNDIEGHWAEGAIKGLAEKGIGLNDECFSPDDEISQEELLKLFAAGIWYVECLNYDTKQLYSRALRSGIIEKGEISADNSVKRGDAFKYIIRMSGLEEVANLQGIFKVEYADRDEVSDELLGYAAILSGMKVISGDGGYLRPNDNITRAEAATVLYNYMNR